MEAGSPRVDDDRRQKHGGRREVDHWPRLAGLHLDPAPVGMVSDFPNRELIGSRHDPVQAERAFAVRDQEVVSDQDLGPDDGDLLQIENQPPGDLRGSGRSKEQPQQRQPHRRTTTSRAPPGTDTRLSEPPGQRTHTPVGTPDSPNTWTAPFCDQYPDPAWISRTGPMRSP